MECWHCRQQLNALCYQASPKFWKWLYSFLTIYLFHSLTKWKSMLNHFCLNPFLIKTIWVWSGIIWGGRNLPSWCHESKSAVVTKKCYINKRWLPFSLDGWATGSLRATCPLQMGQHVWVAAPSWVTQEVLRSFLQAECLPQPGCELNLLPSVWQCASVWLLAAFLGPCYGSHCFAYSQCSWILYWFSLPRDGTAMAGAPLVHALSCPLVALSYIPTLAPDANALPLVKFGKSGYFTWIARFQVSWDDNSDFLVTVTPSTAPVEIHEVRFTTQEGLGSHKTTPQV